MHEPFSLLVPVYDGDRPDYLRRAFRSAVHDQTVRPDQVIIVRDGPVSVIDGNQEREGLMHKQNSPSLPMNGVLR